MTERATLIYIYVCFFATGGLSFLLGYRVSSEGVMLTIEEQNSCRTNRKALYEHGGRMGRKDGLRQHYEQTEGKGVSAVSLGLAMLLLAACTSAGTGPMPVNLASLPDGSIPNSPSEMAQGRAYLIQPGDELSIKFYFSPELNEEHLIVRPDGNISLQLVHEVRAAGHTPMELTRIFGITHALTGFVHINYIFNFNLMVSKYVFRHTN